MTKVTLRETVPKSLQVVEMAVSAVDRKVT
jgi:hypothetical protein